MYQNSFELQVCVNGRPVREHRHNGLVFIEARKGTNYTLKLTNNTFKRGKAIFSVDGVDVLEGKSASDARSGYIIEPHDSIEIKGYRVDDNKVAKFVFTDGYRSYAAEVGKERNNGVIGVRVIGEKEAYLPPCPIPPWKPIPLPWIDPYPSPWKMGGLYGHAESINNNILNDGHDSYSCSLGGGTTTRALNSCQVQQEKTLSEFDTGTGWGEAVQDRVHRVEFEENGVICEMCVYYASRFALERMGVPMERITKVTSGLPQAFETSYCKRPKNWIE